MLGITCPQKANIGTPTTQAVGIVRADKGSLLHGLTVLPINEVGERCAFGAAAVLVGSALIAIPVQAAVLLRSELHRM
jgi:hypothetical protein